MRTAEGSPIRVLPISWVLTFCICRTGWLWLFLPALEYVDFAKISDELGDSCAKSITQQSGIVAISLIILGNLPRNNLNLFILSLIHSEWSSNHLSHLAIWNPGAIGLAIWFVELARSWCINRAISCAWSPSFRNSIHFFYLPPNLQISLVIVDHVRPVVVPSSDSCVVLSLLAIPGKTL